MFPERRSASRRGRGSAPRHPAAPRLIVEPGGRDQRGRAATTGPRSAPSGGCRPQSAHGAKPVPRGSSRTRRSPAKRSSLPQRLHRRNIDRLECKLVGVDQFPAHLREPARLLSRCAAATIPFTPAALSLRDNATRTARIGKALLTGSAHISAVASSRTARSARSASRMLRDYGPDDAQRTVLRRVRD
jgi:hypothetical protein